MSQDKISEPFEKISSELWLMLACASGDTAKTQNLLHQSINWDLLLQLSVHHRVYPLVYKTLSQLNNSVVSEHVLGLLRQKYRQNAIIALSMAGETVRMVRCFESHGIRAIVLKGAPLAWRFYGDITLRPSKDIDILVPFEELEKAVRILESEGYHEIHFKYLTSRQLQIYLKSIKKTRHFVFRHSKKNIYLELHWKHGHGGRLLPMPTESIIKRLKLAGSSVPVLSDEEWLLYLMLHGASHGWFRLRWLIDIAKFIQQGCIDWKKASLLAKNYSMDSILHQSLMLADRLLAVPIPPDLLSSVAHDQSAWRLTCIAMNLCLATADYEIMGNNNQQSKYFRNIYDSQLQPGYKNRFDVVLNFFNPTIFDIKLILLPDRLYALYSFIRPFNSLWRRLRKLMEGN